MINTGDFQKGIFVIFKNEPHQIVEFQHVNPGKGSAFVRTKLKALKTGRVQEFTYKSGESVEDYPVETHEMQFIYKEADKYIFMDNFNYNQYELPQTMIGDYVNYLLSNETYQVLVHDEEAVGMRFPKKVRLKVIEAEEGAKGDTVSGGGSKIAVMETGLKVTVPLFIKAGEKIAIDTETGSYLERA